MPLSALVDDDLLCAPVIPDARWQSLRGARVRLQPCGHEGFPRVSPLGTRHFVHVRDSDCAAGESAEHLHLKAVTARSAAMVGWTPRTEVPGEGFVADVLAEQGDRQVALEIQRSRQTLTEYRRRQETYARAGIRAVWLVANVPAGHLAGPDLPLFAVTRWLGDGRVLVAGRAVPVPGLVTGLLSGRCRWRASVPVTHRLTTRHLLLCPLCGTRRTVVAGQSLAGRCVCGLPVVRPVSPPPPVERACCGHWGPRLPLAVRHSSIRVADHATVGHWCLSA